MLRGIQRGGLAGVLGLSLITSVGAVVRTAPPALQVGTTPWKMPGEFEAQEGLLLAWHPDLEAPLLAIVANTWQRLHIYMLVQDKVDQKVIEDRLLARHLPARAIRFLQIPYETVWTRDYGPVTVFDQEGTKLVVDGYYEDGVEDTRRQDDAVPDAMCRAFRVPRLEAGITVEGGNILSNGDGLLLTTTGLLQKNPTMEEKTLTAALQQFYGARYVLYLEPLHDEATGHVDMFATFTGPRTVVVGSYGPGMDPVNARILDRNADLLSKVRTPWGRLSVERIPMPPPGKEFWRTYTNVLFANGTLLVPTYPDVDAANEKLAFDTYRRLLPGWNIQGVDCSHLIRLEGALRCLTMNLPRGGTGPGKPAPGPRQVAKAPRRIRPAP